MSAEFERIDELFRRALAVPPHERAAWLAERCGDDAALREEVEALLAEDADTSGLLDAPAFGEGVDLGAMIEPPDAVAEGAGTRIGPYRILEQIGEGGFGLVFMAEQTEPVTRRVAIKVIKLGMDTKQVIARFEAERQALALMHHPHIATVLDGGATEAGRPYFVMELCNGAPITAYCDEHELTIDARLELFMQVCRAVEHAHQKGVIHRDVKPSNVLVATQDGRPFVRVIDFGIAKATDARLTERTMFTQHGQLIGTPEYMSPEQVEGAVDIDTRSDVYSLGALLYELLTGVTPFERGRLRSAAFAEIQRIIREVDPPHPSTRLTTTDAASERIAASRRSDPRRLGALVRGDLDWIVMKALEKDRARRYQTASEFASDLERHRAGEPVLAAPPSRAYRVRTFVRRNRGLVAAASFVAAALVIGMIGTSAGLLWALSERDRADGEATRATESAAAETERARELEEVARFQASQLSDIDPKLMGERLRDAIRREGGVVDDVNFTNVALGSLRVDFLEPALAAIDEQFADQPVVRARLLQSVAQTAMALGLFDMARSPLEEALRLREDELGERHPDALFSLAESARLRIELGLYDEGEPIARRALALHRAAHGDDGERTLDVLTIYGSIVRNQGHLDDAYPYYQEALDGYRRTLGPDHPATFVAMNNMGFLLRAMERFEESEQFFRDTLEARRRVLGETDPRTLGSMLNMAYVLHTSGRAEEAEPYYLDALAGQRAAHGDEHPTTLGAMNNIAVYYVSLERYDEAERYLVPATEGRQRVLGLEHRDTLIGECNLGDLYVHMERLDEAEALLEDNVRRCQAVFGPEHRQTIRNTFSLARLRKARGERDAAIALLEEMLHLARRVTGAASQVTRMYEGLLGELREEGS